MLKEVSGYILLLIGVGIISWGIYSSYNIFTAKTDPPVVFESLEIGGFVVNQQQGLESQLGSLIQDQLSAIFPVDSMFKMLNLAVWSIFAGILIFGGAQIAGLGIKLIK